MSVDATIIAALFPQAVATKSTPAPVPVVILAAPPQIPAQVPLPAEIIRIDSPRQIAVQVAQGEIILASDIPLPVRIGQKVEINLPLPSSLAQPALLTLPAAAPVLTAAAGALASAASYTKPSLGPPVVVNVASGLDALSADAPITAAVPSAPSRDGDKGYSLPGIHAAAKPPETLAGQTLPASFINASLGQIEKIDILFVGNAKDATAQLMAYVQSNAMTAAPNIASGQRSITVPFLATIIGLTPQNLPILSVLARPASLETSPMPPNAMRGAVPEGTQLVLHAPVSLPANAAPISSAQPALPQIIAGIISMPVLENSFEGPFPPQTMTQQFPLLHELLNNSENLIAPAIAASLRDMIPRPNTPSFAANLVMSVLGLSRPDLGGIVGQKAMEALAPSQRAQLQKELQALSTLPRGDGVPPPEGQRFNFPVEMAGQFYVWQLTVRPPDDHNARENRASKDEKPTRFILDLSMSNWGAMQVDGLSFARARRLDLILRTRAALLDDIKTGLTQHTLSVFHKADLKGSIAFQEM